MIRSLQWIFRYQIIEVVVKSMYKRQWEIANIYQSSRASFQNKKLLVQQEITAMSNRTSIATSDSEVSKLKKYIFNVWLDIVKKCFCYNSWNIENINKTTYSFLKTVKKITFYIDWTFWNIWYETASIKNKSEFKTWQ